MNHDFADSKPLYGVEYMALAVRLRRQALHDKKCDVNVFAKASKTDVRSND